MRYFSLFAIPFLVHFQFPKAFFSSSSSYSAILQHCSLPLCFPFDNPFWLFQFLLLLHLISIFSMIPSCNYNSLVASSHFSLGADHGKTEWTGCIKYSAVLILLLHKDGCPTNSGTANLRGPLDEPDCGFGRTLQNYPQPWNKGCDYSSFSAPRFRIRWSPRWSHTVLSLTIWSLNHLKISIQLKRYVWDNPVMISDHYEEPTSSKQVVTDPLQLQGPLSFQWGCRGAHVASEFSFIRSPKLGYLAAARTDHICPPPARRCWLRTCVRFCSANPRPQIWLQHWPSLVHCCAVCRLAIHANGFVFT